MSSQGSKQATRVAVAAMIALATGTTAAQAQELLLNGNFEQGSNGVYGEPNWTTYGNGYGSTEYARTEAGQSFKFYAPYSQYAGSVGIQAVTATPGQAYHLTGFMFSPTNDFISPTDFGLLEMGFLDSTGATIGTPTQVQFNSNSAKDTWIPYTVDGTAPANAAKVNIVIGYIQISASNPAGAVYYDDVSLTPSVVVQESNWVATGSGGWLSASNWQNGTIPNAVGATANFGTSITAPSTVTIAGAGVTAGKVTFNNAANAYTIGGTGALTLDVTTGSAALTVTAGSHAINAPLIVNKPTVAAVASGQTLTLGGALTLANGSALSSAGTGTLRINSTSVTGSTGASVHANGGTVQADVDLGTSVDVSADLGTVRFGASQHVRSLNVAAGANATLSDIASATVLRTPSLTIASTGTLDLGDNAAVIDYTGTSPAAAIRAAIITGRNGNNAGSGIISSKAAANSKYAVGYAEDSQIGSPTTFLGETGIDNTTVLARVTLAGDTNLSGTVDFNDLVSLAQNYNGTGKVWYQGDFNYDGNVNFADLVSLAQNYGTTVANLQAAGFDSSFISDWKLATAVAPEPTSLALILGASTMVLRRRAR